MGEDQLFEKRIRDIKNKIGSGLIEGYLRWKVKNGWYFGKSKVISFKYNDSDISIQTKLVDEDVIPVEIILTVDGIIDEIIDLLHILKEVTDETYNQ